MSLFLQVINSASEASSATGTAAPSNEVSISLLDMASKGGPILIPIAILSVLAVYIFFERLFVIQKASKLDANFMNQIKQYVNAGNIDAARNLCRSTKNPSARMIEKGLMRLGKPVREIEAAIENTGKLEVYKLEKNLGYLGTIAGIAPMFGFLGTISGVIKIFYEISKQNSLEIGTISGGLYEKMITSFAGLFVGMIAFAAHQILLQYIDRVINKMEVNSIEFIDLLEEPLN